jgi:D-alanyl-D-alanine carboxypeptidase
MGGSQIFLDANQEYEIGQLLKSVIVCSANDSSVATLQVGQKALS